MWIRYRYRCHPTQAQQQMLARTFGCARVVYNDALALRKAEWQAGRRITDAEVQRRVITAAKHTPERAWLAEVSNVGLIQSCNDARQAHRNYLAALAEAKAAEAVGKPTSLRVRPPRPKQRKARQAVRFTRNGFRVGDNRRVHLTKIGEVKVRWSRPLPSEPSSVTVILEPDGRYYLSFVVEVDPVPLPATDRHAGVDLGLETFATVVTSDGQARKEPNPRFQRAQQRRLRRSQRAVSRKQKGSANRAKARQRLAVQHRKVADRRRDHASKLANDLIRDNQTIVVEDLSVKNLQARGDARKRGLNRSIADAGWVASCASWRQRRLGMAASSFVSTRPTPRGTAPAVATGMGRNP